MLRAAARCSSVPFPENANVEGTPPPSVYWNHDVRAKMQFDLLESIVCGQNLVLIGVSALFPLIAVSASALG